MGFQFYLRDLRLASGRRLFTIFVLASLLASMAPYAGGSPGDGGVPPLVSSARGPIPSMELQIEPPMQQASVDQSKAGAATFSGTVLVDQAIIMRSTITLQAVTNTGWPTEIDPTTFDITGPGEETFELVVIIPPAQSSLITASVIVAATLNAPGLTPIVTQASAIITVEQYFKARLGIDEPYRELERGDDTNVEMLIYNDGNGVTTFRLTIDVPDGIIATLSHDRIMVDQDEYEPFTVHVDVPDNAKAGTYEVVVTAEAMDAEGDKGTTTRRPVFIHVKNVVEAMGVQWTIALIVGIGVASIVSLYVLNKKGKLGSIKGRFARRRSTTGGGGS